MYLTEELLIEWTGLSGTDLFIFYLMYKQHASNSFIHQDLNQAKHNILNYKTNIYDKKYTSKRDTQNLKVKNLIQLWESKVKR